MMLHARLANMAAPRATWVFRSATRIPVTTTASTTISVGSSRVSVLRLKATASRRGFSASSTSSASSTNSSSRRENIFKRAWTKYLGLLATRPIATKVVTASVIAGLGDINSQLFLERNHRFSVKRAAIFTFLSGVCIAPILHGWYGFLIRTAPGSSPLAVAKRLAMDQLGFAPSFLPIFFTALLTLEGDMDKVPDKIALEWWPVVKANWVVWVPAQLLNFRFVPAHLQVLFSNVVGFFWNSYLSFVSHLDEHPVEEPTKDATTKPLLATSTEP